MSLQDELLRDFSDGFSKRAEESLNSTFLNNRVAWTNEAINGYMRHEIDPNVAIAKIATTNKLNAEQTQRIVEETNVGIYLQKYAQTKGKRIRRVEFPLADMNKISIENNSELPKTAATVETSDVASLQKVASTTEKSSDMCFDLPEKQANDMMINTAEYEAKLWEREAMHKTASEMLKRKIVARAHEAELNKLAEIKDTLQKIACIGDALIFNEKSGQSAQKLLSKIASDASLEATYQQPILRYVNEKVASMKRNKSLRESFSIDLSPVAKESNNFSLGSHSFMKTAETIQDLRLPDPVQYADLISIAKEVKKKMQSAEGTPQAPIAK